MSETFRQEGHKEILRQGKPILVDWMTEDLPPGLTDEGAAAYLGVEGQNFRRDGQKIHFLQQVLEGDTPPKVLQRHRDDFKKQIAKAVAWEDPLVPRIQKILKKLGVIP